MLAAKAPPKKVATRTIAAAAPGPSRTATSLAKRPTLPVTWDVKTPRRTNPAELTKPPMKARYPASAMFWRSERCAPWRVNTALAPGADDGALHGSEK